MSELFLKMLNMSIAASWLVLAVLLLRFVLKKAPKWVNVLLWGIVALRLVLPFSFESALSLIPSAETVPMDIAMAARPAIDSGVGVINSAVNPVLAASFTPNPMTSANPLQILIPVWAVLWLAGILALLVYTAVSYWRLRCRVREAVRLRDNVYQSENVASPFVLGILRPKIYLPYNMDGQSLQHVVAHEQAHIRRRDHWWKPLGFLLLAIYWFNPLLWLAYVLLCRDIEMACDEKVVRELGNAQRADYTQALVSCSVFRRSIAACPLAFGEVGVKARVKSVLHYKKPAFWIIVAAVAVCVAVAVCFLTVPKEPVRELLKPGTAWACEEPQLYFSVGDNYVVEGRLAHREDEIGISVGYRFAGRNSAVFELYSGDWEWAQKAAEEPLLTGILRAKNGKLILEVEKDNLGLQTEQIEFTEGSEWRSFRAEILAVHDGYYLVKPLEGWALKSADQIEVPMRNMAPSPEPLVGDVIEVVCSGEILETYPARLQEVYSIRVVRQEIQFPEKNVPNANDLLEAFRSSIPEGKTVIVTDHVIADDGAYGLDGVVQYADETGAPWNLAFVRDGAVFPVGQEWGADYAIASELHYLGGGVVRVYLENLTDNTFYVCEVAYSYDEATKQTHFKSSSDSYAPPPGAGPVTAVLASEELLAGMDYHEALTNDSEYAVKLLFRANEALTDVYFSALSYEDDGKIGEEKLLSVPELRPDNPLVVSVVFYGDMTTYGISFTDAGGNARHYSVYLSGKDGSLQLSEYRP